VREIFDNSPERDQDDVKRPNSEYRRSICGSAEKTRDQDEGLPFPSYQKFKENKSQIEDTE
jgi:hypothetical protein